MRENGFLILNLRFEQAYPLSQGDTGIPALLPLGTSPTQHFAKEIAEGRPSAAEAERGWLLSPNSPSVKSILIPWEESWGTKEVRYMTLTGVP